jgi:trk system potassium uptake protein TrkA
LYLNEGNILSIVTIFNEDAEIIELVPSKNSILINRKLKDITEFPPHTLIGVIEHNNHPFIPNGESVIHKNDKLLIFVKKSYLDNVLKLFK